MTDRWAVYDLIVDGELVYVGCTKNPKMRLGFHKARRKVPRDCVMRVVAWYDCQHEALSAERRRIIKRKPPLNKAHREDIKKAVRAEKGRKAYERELAKWEAIAEANRKKVAEIEADYAAWVLSGQQQ